MTAYLSVVDVLDLHLEVMEATGSEPQPPRSLEALESALWRAAMAEQYAGADLIAQAARIATGISRAQAFLDGNKRTALATTATFLQMNGQPFRGDALEGAQLLEVLADPAIGDDEADERFEAWLRTWCDA